MRNTVLRLFLAAVLLSNALLLTFPAPVKADGGPMVDPLLFAKLKEGQQVAVIKLWGSTEASVDLFVSILDQTGESHEITYFVPLGVNPSQFQVVEEDSIAFANSQTTRLDRIVSHDYRQDRLYLQNLFAGALLTNGVWLTPLWLPMLLSGCAGVAPVSSFTTESSKVDVFNIDQTTDIESLISTTGLDISVKDTLSRLQGQQIAVIKINTSPNPGPIAQQAGTAGTEPGLHLYWQTPLTANKDGMTYAYPLGTGVAWANPIEMTRVYIKAPFDLNFKVQYPKLGTDHSGFGQNGQPLITGYANEATYAVEYAKTPNDMQVSVWRATYMNSNSAEDILITVLPYSKKTLDVALGTFLWQQGTSMALLIGLVVAALFWILAWYFLAPRLAGKNVSTRGLWRISLTYIWWNLLLFLPGGIIYFIFQGLGGIIPLEAAFVLFGGASAIIFASRHLDKLNKISGNAFKIFAIVTAVSGGAYLLFALGYANLVGAI